MSEKNKNRNLKKNTIPVPPAPSSRGAVSWLRDRHPVLKFLLGFIGCMAVFYTIYYAGFYQEYVEKPILSLQANAASALLHLLGHDTKVMGAAIGAGNFSIDIQNGCDGLEALAILVSGILIFPATPAQKGRGLLWGIPVLMVLNLLRIVGLYLSGVYFSKFVFELLHIQGGFILFTMISVLILFTWMSWVMRSQTPPNPSS